MHTKYHTCFLKYTLLSLFLYALVFACNHYYNTVIQNYTPQKVYCQGIVLNQNLSYHITSKKSLAKLKAIRPNLEVNENDLLLHFNTYDVDKTSPSYWGSLIYNTESQSWQFHVDKSISSDINSPNNALLPFIKAVKKGKSTYYQPKDSISQEVLMNDIVYVNSLSGNRNTRYYIKISKFKEDYDDVLSFYDEGVKRTYEVRKQDTIAVNFNTNTKASQHQALLEYNFKNTSNSKGQYLLINNGRKFVVKNQKNQLERNIADPDYFTIEDIAFSTTPKFNLCKKWLLFLYIIIVCTSFLFFWKFQFNQQQKNLVVSYKNELILSLFIFQLLGFPILVQAFELFDKMDFGRLLALSLFVPLVPLFSHFLKQKNWIKKGKEGIQKVIFDIYPWFNKLLSKNFNIKQRHFVLLFIVIYFVGVLFFTRNERVYGIPVLHFFKLLIWVLIWFLYNPNFKVSSSILNLIPTRYTSFMKSIIILFFGFINSWITSDFGSLAFVFFACLILEYTVGSFDNKEGEHALTFFGKKINPKHIIYCYCIFALILFFAGGWVDLWSKSYRITYGFWNPSSFFYTHNGIGDRETISLLYQNLKLIFSLYPLGIHDVQIPSYAKSVSHTDYALHWSFVRFGVLFFIPLLMNSFLFIRGVSKLIYVLSKADDNYQYYTNKPSNYQMFVVFVLIYTILQIVMPILSNSLTPFAFLTGVPFPGISISIGDAVFLFILLSILNLFEVNPKFKLNTPIYDNAHLYSLEFSKNVFRIIAVLFLFKIVLLFFQSEETAFEYPKKNGIVLPAAPTGGWATYVATHFKSEKNLTELSKADKKILNEIKCRYYSGQNKKLLADSKAYYLNTTLLKQKLSPTYKFTRTKKIISSDVWNQQFDTVYQSHKYVNGKKELYTNSKYFDAIDFTNKSLDKDLTALVNRQVEAFVGQHKELEVKVLVSENSTGNLIVDANYPLENTHKNPSFYAASGKKIILALHYAKQPEPVVLYVDENNTISPENWIATSSNEGSIYYFSTIKDLAEFEIFLENNFDLAYTSNSYQNGYHTDDSRAPSVVVIGGKIKYSAYQIHKWIEACAKNSFEKNNQQLKVILNSPLLSKYGRGTALKTARVLKNEGANIDNFICKTGTQESTSGKKNLGTSFMIANKDYSFTMFINGYVSRKHAKDLFNKLVPVLKPCLLEKTE